MLARNARNNNGHILRRFQRSKGWYQSQAGHPSDPRRTARTPLYIERGEGDDGRRKVHRSGSLYKVLHQPHKSDDTPGTRSLPH